MAAVVFVVLLLSIAFTVGLYLLIESETSNPTVVDRETAEREAKKQGGLRRRSQRSERVADDRFSDRGRSHGRGHEQPEPEPEPEPEATAAKRNGDRNSWDDRTPADDRGFEREGR